MENSDDTFHIISSIRWDPTLFSADYPFLYLRLHQERLLRAAKAFEWPRVVQAIQGESGLANLKEQCEKDAALYRELLNEEAPLRVRILLSEAGVLTTEVHPTSPRPFNLFSAADFNPEKSELRTSFYPLTPLRVYLDTHPTPSSLFTSYKTTRRSHYTASRTRFRITPSTSEKAEVLLFNEQGVVTEGTIRNVCLWRAGRWVTAPLTSGCLDGVGRRWLLDNVDGKVVEGTVMKSDVKLGEWVLLSNGVEGCSLGQVVDYSN